jgi:hypothetical protein
MGQSWMEFAAKRTSLRRGLIESQLTFKMDDAQAQSNVGDTGSKGDVLRLNWNFEAECARVWSQRETTYRICYRKAPVEVGLSGNE